MNIYRFDYLDGNQYILAESVEEALTLWRAYMTGVNPTTDMSTEEPRRIRRIVYDVIRKDGKGSGGGAVSEREIPDKDWLVRIIIDHGEREALRYTVIGENLNHIGGAGYCRTCKREAGSGGCIDRPFSWRIPASSLGNPRYDVSQAVHDNPTHKLRQLLPGHRFRYAGCPSKHAVYVVVEGAPGSYRNVKEAGEKYPPPPWVSPDLDVVLLETEVKR